MSLCDYSAKPSILNTCLVIILIVAPALAAARPQNHEQKGTAQSQAGTKSIAASDPCGSFPPLSPAANGAVPEKTDKVDSTPTVQAGVMVRISPHTDTRLAAGYALSHTATVSGSTNTAVEWTVDGPGCSNHACGTFIGDVYFAPVTAPSPPIVRLTATSKADSRASDSIGVCVVQHGPQWNLSSAVGEFRKATLAAAVESGNDAARNNSSAGMGRPYEITSDTMGVDFGPYLRQVVHVVKQNWNNIIPPSAKAPLYKKGKVSIEFVILKNGQVAGIHYVISSGDVDLDRAAYGGITYSNPFPPLPAEFRGQYLGLRFHFWYNPSLTGIAPSGAQLPSQNTVRH
jgi:TonB family protein